MTTAHEYRYTWDGDEYRVVVAGDVVSIPGRAGAPGWSMGGFGPSISEEWLLHEGGLPGARAKRKALALMVQRSLAAAHGQVPREAREGEPRGPFERCRACALSPVAGYVPVSPPDASACTLCGLDVSDADGVVGQASGPHGVILHDYELAHRSCLERARRGEA